MITINGNDIHKDGQKIGWINDGHIYGEGGRQIGYMKGNDIYHADGHKIAYLEGETLHKEAGGSVGISEIRNNVSGGSVSDLERSAAHILFGG